MSLRPEQIVDRRWVHAHEEDTAEEIVFRPATYPLPPSRGRTSLELRSDGTYVKIAPGPVDVPEESRGWWSIEGDRLMLGAAGDRSGRVCEIAAATGDRVVVRK